MATTKDDDIEALELTPSQRQLALSNPLLFAEIWTEMQQAVMINDWPIIIGAISNKASKGDTAAAKFITDFIEPLAKTDHSSNDTTSVEWEDKAIALRDYLSLEMSGVMLVEILIDKLQSMPKDFTLELLSSSENDSAPDTFDRPPFG